MNFPLGAMDGVVNLGQVGAVPTGPRGIGVKSIAYRGSALRVTLTDEREVVVPMPIGGGMGEGATGDPATSIPLTQEVVDYVTSTLEPYGITDEEVKARLAKVEGDIGTIKTVDSAQNGRLDTLAATADAHTKRLDAIAASVQAVIDTGATDAEVAKALADLRIADYLSISDAAATYATKTHAHPEGDIEGLSAKLADMEARIATATGVDMSSYATDAEVDTKVADAVKAYLTQSAADGRYAPLSHKHAIADITGLQAELDKRFITPTTGTTGDVLTWDGAKLALKAGGASIDTSGFIAKSVYGKRGDLLVGSGGGSDPVALSVPGVGTGLLQGLSSGTIQWANPFTERFSMSGPLAVKSGAARCYNLGNVVSINTIHAVVGTAPVGGPVTIVVKKDGVTIATLSIAAGSTTATAMPSDSTWAANSYLTVDVTAVGTTTAGSDLVVTVKGA